MNTKNSALQVQTCWNCFSVCTTCPSTSQARFDEPRKARRGHLFLACLHARISNTSFLRKTNSCKKMRSTGTVPSTILATQIQQQGQQRRRRWPSTPSARATFPACCSRLGETCRRRKKRGGEGLATMGWSIWTTRERRSTESRS